MEAATQILILDPLKNNFGDDIQKAEMLYDFLTITVKKEKITDIIKYLHDDEQLKFRFLTDLCAVHYPDTKTIAVVYHLHSLVNNYRIRIKTYLDVENPVISTLTLLFPAANWMERETYDFYGVVFKGHPNLKRILNVDDILIFPMRKEYPLEDQTRQDKNDVMFGR